MSEYACYGIKIRTHHARDMFVVKNPLSWRFRYAMLRTIVVRSRLMLRLALYVRWNPRLAAFACGLSGIQSSNAVRLRMGTIIRSSTIFSGFGTSIFHVSRQFSGVTARYVPSWKNSTVPRFTRPPTIFPTSSLRSTMRNVSHPDLLMNTQKRTLFCNISNMFSFSRSGTVIP